MINFPDTVNQLPQYLFRKGDCFYKPYDLISNADNSLSLLCGRVNISLTESLEEGHTVDKVLILLADFINPDNEYIAIDNYTQLKVLLDEAQLNNSRQFFSAGFNQVQPQSIADLNQLLNP